MNIINYIKISIHQICQCIFKPITFSKSIDDLDKKSKIKLLLKLSFFSFIISTIVAGVVRGVVFSFGYPFDCIEILVTVLLFTVVGIAVGIVLGIVRGIARGIVVGIAVGIAWGIAFGIAVGIAEGIVLGIVLGIVVGIAVGIAFGIAFGIAVGIAEGIAEGIVMGISVGIVLGIAEGIVMGIAMGIAVGIAFLFSYFRIFYILPQAVQYLRAKVLGNEPFGLFRNSPIYWDEVIIMPLPFLSNFLVTLANANREKGLSEIEFVSSERPLQRKAASSALLELTVQDLSRFESVNEMAEVSTNLSFLSSFEGYLPGEFGNAVRTIEDISMDARSYLDSTSKYNESRNLIILSNDVDKFKKTLIATKGSVGYRFLSVAEKWSQIITEENNKFIELRKDTFEEIPNPYIFGNPVRPDDKSRLFVGRLDIIEDITSNLSNVSQKPTLFLYGRRRVGKSSVLVNLPRFLGKQYISAYIDCQDVRTRESLTSFCHTLSRSISDSSNDRGFSIEYPPLESFRKSPFTTLGNWFDEIEQRLRTEDKLILIALDEYERLEESILKGDLSIEILDQLRNIIQHRKYFVVLITGSKELSELELDWSDYLISAKTIKLGYLSKEDAKILITNPIDDFSLNYHGGENGEVVNKIIDVTSCQPYLVQALCFELVNCLNTQNRKEAIMGDIDAAIEKVLISANNYFYYIWNSECSEKEKEFLKRLMDNLPVDGNEAEINSLMKKEIIEKVNGDYEFKVELLKKWIEKNN